VKIVWLELAIFDLHQVREFIRLDNPPAAEKAGIQIESTILNLARFPDMGRAGRRPQTRELMIPGLPYRVVYRVRGDTVQILRVYHTKRRWPQPF
jgi:toxin ParE1/3/4